MTYLWWIFGRRAEARFFAVLGRMEQAKAPSRLPVDGGNRASLALFSVLRIFTPANHPRAWGHGTGMEGVWYWDGHYPEDVTPKCSFFTTCVAWFFAEMRRPKAVWVVHGMNARE